MIASLYQSGSSDSVDVLRRRAGRCSTTGSSTVGSAIVACNALSEGSSRFISHLFREWVGEAAAGDGLIGRMCRFRYRFARQAARGFDTPDRERPGVRIEPHVLPAAMPLEALAAHLIDHVYCGVVVQMPMVERRP